uniref:Uncharacterized protein n=1 Tax=Arundo donax TaxID=35708 RepID=A0A0A9TR47_ARUDO
MKSGWMQMAEPEAKEMLDHLGRVLANTEPGSVKIGQFTVEVKPQVRFLDILLAFHKGPCCFYR